MEIDVIHVNPKIVQYVKIQPESVPNANMDSICIKINVIHVQQWIIVLIVIMETDVKSVLKDIS